MLRTQVLVIAVSILCGWAEPGHAGAVLDRVKTNDRIACGVLTVPEDFGKSDVHGALIDFGADVCQAVAAAALGDATKVAVIGFPDEAHGLAAVEAGSVDVLMGASPARSSDIVYGVAFTRPVFFDAEGVMVNLASGITSFADLAGKQVCYIGSTRADDVLVSLADRRKIGILPFPFEEVGEMDVAFLTGHCDAVVASMSSLANVRASFHGRINEFTILPDQLSIEPMAPAVRAGDPHWMAVLDATLDALLTAESAGIGRVDAARLRNSDDPLMHGLTGLVPGVDEKLVPAAWAYRAVAAAGNYAEVYARDVGAGSALGLARGPNALAVDGGLMLPGAPR